MKMLAGRVTIKAELYRTAVLTNAKLEEIVA